MNPVRFVLSPPGDPTAPRPYSATRTTAACEARP